MAASPVAGKGKHLMAVRHDVENLIRRGNIFYWRARIPNAFGQCRPGSRLSLSLHCSDHKKAQAIGLKLNMLMAELKMNSKEPMSKAQLQKLCEHQRDMMLLHLEDVSTAARRNCRPEGELWHAWRFWRVRNADALGLTSRSRRFCGMFRRVFRPSPMRELSVKLIDLDVRIRSVDLRSREIFRNSEQCQRLGASSVRSFPGERNTRFGCIDGSPRNEDDMELYTGV
ncbi:hypothetical protein [Rhizobium hainanense]|uniref:Uncharacterized protein n=1 Tax=Rhizobium hainanense TaxID=52131 RepID=A0A1C3V1V4_9HYPH|nr:hypothetical protein [Rhizobium hainanense]SCB21766.1 hypothetical protein GA0061100_104142 [Rhizobium hainanense]